MLLERALYSTAFYIGNIILTVLYGNLGVSHYKLKPVNSAKHYCVFVFENHEANA